MENMKIGNACIFVDRDGRERNALVIWTWKTCLNIICVDVDGITANSYGHGTIRETSVPYFEEGMKGFYIKDNHPTLAQDRRTDGYCTCKELITKNWSRGRCINCGGVKPPNI